MLKHLLKPHNYVLVLWVSCTLAGFSYCSFNYSPGSKVMALEMANVVIDISTV